MDLTFTDYINFPGDALTWSKNNPKTSRYLSIDYVKSPDADDNSEVDSSWRVASFIDRVEDVDDSIDQREL